MTIDELLAEARRYSELATSSNGDRAMFAQIAQACAQTAQAMILAKTARPDYDDTNRTFAVDTGN